MQCNYNSFNQIINFCGLFRNALRCRKTGACRILVPLRYLSNNWHVSTILHWLWHNELYSITSHPLGFIASWKVVLPRLLPQISLTHWVLDHSWIGFLKILNYVPKERDNIYCKNWALICPVNMLRWLIGIILGESNLRILKLATYTKNEDHYSRCKLAWFCRLETDYHNVHTLILSTQNIKCFCICNENKEISVANLMIQ